MTGETFKEFLLERLADNAITAEDFALLETAAELLCSEVILITDLEQLLGLQYNKEYVEAEVSFRKEYRELEKPFIANYKEEFFRNNSSGQLIDGTLNILDYYKEGKNSFLSWGCSVAWPLAKQVLPVLL